MIVNNSNRAIYFMQKIKNACDQIEAWELWEEMRIKQPNNRLASINWWELALMEWEIRLEKWLKRDSQ